jgi:hypothetical protein
MTMKEQNPVSFFGSTIPSIKIGRRPPLNCLHQVLPT